MNNGHGVHTVHGVHRLQADDVTRVWPDIGLRDREGLALKSTSITIILLLVVVAVLFAVSRKEPARRDEGASEAQTLARLETKRDAMIARVVEIYQLVGEPADEVFLRVLKSRTDPPTLAEWSEIQKEPSVENLHVQVEWLQILIHEAP